MGVIIEKHDMKKRFMRFDRFALQFGYDGSSRHPRIRIARLLGI
jgi:hypothetical protein